MEHALVRDAKQKKKHMGTAVHNREKQRDRDEQKLGLSNNTDQPGIIKLQMLNRIVIITGASWSKSKYYI